jgi:hypothetical protein
VLDPRRGKILEQVHVNETNSCVEHFVFPVVVRHLQPVKCCILYDKLRLDASELALDAGRTRAGGVRAFNWLSIVTRCAGDVFATLHRRNVERALEVVDLRR